MGGKRDAQADVASSPEIEDIILLTSLYFLLYEDNSLKTQSVHNLPRENILDFGSLFFKQY